MHLIHRILGAHRRRLVFGEWMRRTVRAALFFYAILVVFIAFAWWSGNFHVDLRSIPIALTWPWVLAAPAGLFLALLRRPSLHEVAGLVDTRAQTRDRLVTALVFTEKTSRTEIEELALQESVAYVREKDFRTATPLRLPEELRWVLVPLLTLGLLWWDGWRLNQAEAAKIAESTALATPTVRQLEDIAKKVASAADDETARKLAERLRDAARQLKAAGNEGRDAEQMQKAALRELAELEALVNELRQPSMPTPEELQALADALAKRDATREIARDIAEGKPEAAAEKLQQAAKDPQTSEQVKQSIQEALNHLAQRKEQLSKQLEQMRQQGQEGGDSERQQVLQQLADALQKMGGHQQAKAKQQGNQKQAGGKAGKEMSTEDLKKLLTAIQQMKDQQQGDQQEGNGPGEPGEGEPNPGEGISMLNFSQSPGGNQGDDGDKSMEQPSGQPGSEKDTGTTDSPLGAKQAAADPGKQEQSKGRLGEGESLSALVPSAAKGDAKALQRYREITDAAASAAADAVTQENLPLGSRFLIKRYFEAIRPK